MRYDTDNIFAKILRGEIPCDTVFENNHAIALRDINPQAPVHILIIPKGSYTSLSDFSIEASIAEKDAFFQAIGQVVTDFDLAQKGYRTICNIGKDGRQEVPHFHMHILGGEKLGPMVSKS